ncbi:hypothetical protein Hypma_004433 [Hypsizygus marmoreus]|uniref:Uncharacterized protein n=1 Tax=Hypsizygus marmoreus TaxID=39966 RepID=A0A369K8G6_HYPMA|nr:hypothetical protein Hypma_004433 [Hypsizygus marmoreus]
MDTFNLLPYRDYFDWEWLPAPTAPRCAETRLDTEGTVAPPISTSPSDSKTKKDKHSPPAPVSDSDCFILDDYPTPYPTPPVPAEVSELDKAAMEWIYRMAYGDPNALPTAGDTSIGSGHNSNTASASGTRLVENTETRLEAADALAFGMGNGEDVRDPVRMRLPAQEREGYFVSEEPATASSAQLFDLLSNATATSVKATRDQPTVSENQISQLAYNGDSTTNISRAMHRLGETQDLLARASAGLFLLNQDAVPVDIAQWKRTWDGQPAATPALTERFDSQLLNGPIVNAAPVDLNHTPVPQFDRQFGVHIAYTSQRQISAMAEHAPRQSTSTLQPSIVVPNQTQGPRANKAQSSKKRKGIAQEDKTERIQIECRWRGCEAPIVSRNDSDYNDFMEETRVHMKDHCDLRTAKDENNKFPCQWEGCTEGPFKDPRTLWRHLCKREHADTTIPCPDCGAQLARESCLKSHRGSSNCKANVENKNDEDGRAAKRRKSAM